jgi:hypothetical protein
MRSMRCNASSHERTWLGILSDAVCSDDSPWLQAMGFWNDAGVSSVRRLGARWIAPQEQEVERHDLLGHPTDLEEKTQGEMSSASVEHLFTSLQRKLRVERTRMINELTGDGNVVWEQSMRVKRQP